MTEEKRQSTIQPEQIQGFNSLEEDELNLIDLLKIIARKKVFILAVTSVCTLFSILYVQSITPVYRATVGLLDQNEKFSPFSIFEELYGGPLQKNDPFLVDKVDHQIIKPINVFERLIFNIQSQELKQKVFVNGDFQKKYSQGTVIDTEQSEKDLSVKFFPSLDLRQNGKVTHIEMEGTKPKVMLEFLTVLVEAAKENVNIEIKEKVRSIFKTKINNLATQIEELIQNITVQKQMEKEYKAMQKQIAKERKALEIEELIQNITVQKQIAKEKKALEKEKKALEIEKLHQQKQKQKQIEIALLSEAVEMARRMGIKSNNLDKSSNQGPLWFRYGELALQQKINMLRSKEEEIPNTTDLSIEKLKLQRLQEKLIRLRSKEQEIPNNKKLSIENNKKLSIKKLQLKRWQTTDLPLPKFKVTAISEQRYYLANKQDQPWMIVGSGVAVGLFIGICIAFLIDLKQFSRPKESASDSK